MYLISLFVLLQFLKSNTWLIENKNNSDQLTKFFKNELKGSSETTIVVGAKIKIDSPQLRQSFLKESTETVYSIIIPATYLKNDSKLVLTKAKKIYIITSVKPSLIAEQLWKMNLPQSLIIKFDSDNKLQVYSYAVLNCGAKVKMYRKNTLENLDFSKFLYKCPIYVIWSSLPPYVIDPKLMSMSGIFVDFLNDFGTRIGRKIIFQPYDSTYLAEVSDAKRFDSVFFDLANGYADMFIGPTNLSSSSVFDISPILTDNNILILSPKPVASIWRRLLSEQIITFMLFYPFMNMFFAFLITYVAKKAGEVKNFTVFSKNFCILFQVSLGLSFDVVQNPQTVVIRMISVIIFLSYMIYIIYIQGSVIGGLSGSAYGKSITNIDDLLKTDLPIKTVDSMAFLFRNALQEKDMEVYQRLEILKNVKYPFLVGDLAVQYKNFSTIIDDGYLIMRPNILKSFSVFNYLTTKPIVLMPKGAHFSKQYSEWFQRLIEIGCIAKYMRLYQHLYSCRLENFVKEDKRQFIVKIEDVLPIMALSLMCYSLGLTAFCVELIIFKSRKLKKDKNPRKTIHRKT